jgi:glucan phosphoethanolaminetransferase (alkaline phosphatase superfamily)
MAVVWHDPNIIRTEVIHGTMLVIASIAYIMFAVFFAGKLRRRVRWILVLGAMIILLAVQLAYLSSSSIIVYGVYYDEITRTFQYSTVNNPVANAVMASAIMTLLIGGAMTAYYILEESTESLGRIPRRRVYYEF